MTRTLILITFGLLAACEPEASTLDPRSNALAGLWCLVMDGQTSTRTSGLCASVALVAVRRDAKPARERRRLAEGAISMFRTELGEPLPDGTPVHARTTQSDSVMLEFATTRGDFHVYLTGVLRADTLAGRWSSILGRSRGSRGTFIMTRVR